MDRMLQGLFVGAIKEQAAFALKAAGNINAALERLGHSPTEIPPPLSEFEAASDDLWFWIHALLNAGANISKMLWPQPNRATAAEFPDRGEELRLELGVKDGSPLSNRDLRNHLEHLDERFETWWIQDPRHNIARRMVAPLEDSIVGFDQGQRFEWFDPGLGIACFQGEAIALQPLVDAVVEVRAAAERFEAAERGR